MKMTATIAAQCLVDDLNSYLQGREPDRENHHCSLENALCVKSTLDDVAVLGAAIEEGDPQKIADLWLQLKPQVQNPDVKSPSGVEVKVRCFVLGKNASGQPEFVHSEQSLSQEDYNDGKHYQMAREQAYSAGFEVESVFDEHDPAAKQLFAMEMFRHDTPPDAFIAKVLYKQTMSRIVDEASRYCESEGADTATIEVDGDFSKASDDLKSHIDEAKKAGCFALTLHC